MKIPLVGAELFLADGRTYRSTDMAKLIVAFRNFANAHIKEFCVQKLVYVKPEKETLVYH
jgi:hypothetical protein